MIEALPVARRDAKHLIEWIIKEEAHPVRTNTGLFGIEIEDDFLGDLGCGIGGREDFDANLRGAHQKRNVLANLIPTGIKPTDINSFDAVSGRNRALGQSLALRSKLNQ
jgi:hypothetical protein